MSNTIWFNSKEAIIEKLLTDWDPGTFNLSVLKDSSLEELQEFYLEMSPLED